MATSFAQDVTKGLNNVLAGNWAWIDAANGFRSGSMPDENRKTALLCGIGFVRSRLEVLFFIMGIIGSAS